MNDKGKRRIAGRTHAAPRYPGWDSRPFYHRTDTVPLGEHGLLCQDAVVVATLRALGACVTIAHPATFVPTPIIEEGLAQKRAGWDYAQSTTDDRLDAMHAQILAAGRAGDLAVPNPYPRSWATHDGRRCCHCARRRGRGTSLTPLFQRFRGVQARGDGRGGTAARLARAWLDELRRNVHA
jgi:hypothetical protein